jgi:septal ring factor EnvC (AmiA/AmiB activator)
MNSRTTMMAASHLDFWRSMIVAGGLAAGMVLFTVSSHAASPQVPWECSNYGEEAQTRCLNAFIEHQREQIDKLEGELQAQRETVGQLKGQIDRQSGATADLQQQLSQSPTTVVPTPYAYTYAYPPVGLGLYLGRPWIYGPPYYYHPYWGPRFYGRWGRRW